MTGSKLRLAACTPCHLRLNSETVTCRLRNFKGNQALKKITGKDRNFPRQGINIHKQHNLQRRIPRKRINRRRTKPLTLGNFLLTDDSSILNSRDELPPGKTEKIPILTDQKSFSNKNLNQLKKPALNNPCYWSSFAVTDHCAVNLYDRGDFAAGTNDHDFVHEF